MLPELEKKLLDWDQEQRESGKVQLSVEKATAEERNIKEFAHFTPTILWLKQFNNRNNVKIENTRVSRGTFRNISLNKFKVTVVACAEKFGNRPAGKVWNRQKLKSVAGVNAKMN